MTPQIDDWMNESIACLECAALPGLGDCGTAPARSFARGELAWQ